MKRAVMRLHEPRIISAVYGGVYTLAAIIGMVAVFYPPRTIEHVAGSVIMAVLAALIFATAFVLMRSLWIFDSPYSHITGKRLPR